MRPSTDFELVRAWFRLGWEGQRARMAWLLFGSATVGALQAGFGYLWKVVMDTAATGDAAQAGRAMVVVGVAQSALYVFVQGTRTYMNGHIQRVARDRVYAAVLTGDLDGLRTGDIVTRLTDDLSEEKLAWFLCSGVFRAVEAVMVVAASIAAMAWIAPGLTLACLVPLPLLLIVHRRVGGQVTARAAAVQEAIARLGNVVHDAFTGVRVLQSAGLEPLAERAFGEVARSQSTAEVANTRSQQLFFAQFAYGWQFALAVLLCVGGGGIHAGTATVAEVSALSGFLMTMVFQMFDFSAFVVRGRQAAASLRRLEAVLARPPVPRPAAAPPGPFTLPRRIARPHLALTLPDDVTVPAGAFIAVTGAVGAGKSTLLAAIAARDGVCAPPAAWVPQEPALFSVSIADNIRLGHTDPADPDARVAAEGACLTSDLARMPEGLATMVGERGVTLSGGQQQRVQLARALYTRRPLLVLDDATSALDADTEARFWDGLAAAPGGRCTVVASTHRIATLARADQVIWLRRTGPEEATATVGPHAELLRDPAYAALYGAPTA